MILQKRAFYNAIMEEIELSAVVKAITEGRVFKLWEYNYPEKDVIEIDLSKPWLAPKRIHRNRPDDPALHFILNPRRDFISG